MQSIRRCVFLVLLAALPTLTVAQHHRILRQIYGRMGRNAYRDGDWRPAVSLLLRAIRHGAGPLAIALFLLRASGPARALTPIAKRLLRR